MLAASNISLRLGGALVLKGVSLCVRPGEVLAVIGPNGAGKSSLMNVLSGALVANEGEVTLDGRALKTWRRRDLALRRAVLPQAPVLTFPFRVLDVVLLGRSPHAGRTGAAADLCVAEAALRETDALHLAERVYPTLSGGERQRVQLARILAQLWPEEGWDTTEASPRFMLLDEPTNNLDIAHQQAMMATARRFAAPGNGVLAVLHDANLAALHADRIAVLSGGLVVAEGTPEDVITKDLLEATFGLEVTVLRHPGLARPVMLPG